MNISAALNWSAGIFLCVRSTNTWRCYSVKPSVIAWAQKQNAPLSGYTTVYVPWTDDVKSITHKHTSFIDKDITTTVLHMFFPIDIPFRREYDGCVYGTWHITYFKHLDKNNIWSTKILLEIRKRLMMDEHMVLSICITPYKCNDILGVFDRENNYALGRECKTHVTRGPSQ